MKYDEVCHVMVCFKGGRSMIFLSILLIAQITPFVPGDSGEGILSSGVIVINEFMAHPLASYNEESGEWVELYNRSGDWINLSGWVLSNALGQEVTMSTYLLPPEGYYVLCACGDESMNGGLIPDYVYGNFTINDTGRLTLISASREIIDEIIYTSSWPVTAGHSCERINPGWISSTPSTWDVSTIAFGNGDFGSPGSLNSVYENSFVQNSWAFIKAFVQ